MAQITQDYLGRLTNRLSQVFLENIGIEGAPLAGCTTGIPDTDAPNTTVTVSLMLENVKGRTAQTLIRGDDEGRAGGLPGSRYDNTPGDPLYRVYTRYGNPANVTSTGAATGDANTPILRGPDAYGRPMWQQFKITPDFIQESMYRFTLADLENLNDDAFIARIVQPTLFESVRRQVMMRFYQTLFNPYYYVNTIGGSTSSNSLSLLLNAVITDYDDMGVGNIDNNIYVPLRKRLLNKVMEGGGVKLLSSPDLYAGVATSNDNINWMNTYGSLKALENRNYGKFKNVEFHEVDFVDTDQDIQHDGLDFPTAPAAGHIFPHLSNQTTAAQFTQGSAAATFRAVPRNGTDAEAPLTTDKIVGCAFNKRAIGMGLWNRWEASRFAGNTLGTVTSFFTDPLSGVTFRLETYYLPEDQEYRIVCSAKVGFVSMDFRAAQLVLYRTRA